MTKTFCDRCGKEITHKPFAWINHKTVYAKLSLTPSQPDEDWKEHNKYICKDCEDSYIHWFMRPEGETRAKGATDNGVQ